MGCWFGHSNVSFGSLPGYLIRVFYDAFIPMMIYIMLVFMALDICITPKQQQDSDDLLGGESRQSRVKAEERNSNEERALDGE